MIATLWSSGLLDATVICGTNSAGQPVCTGSTTGLFASLGILLFIYLAFAVIGIIAAVKVVTKAGYSGWWILITFVPFVGAIFVLIFAFSKWPVTSEVEMLRARLVTGGGYGRPGGYGPGPVASGPEPSFPPPGPATPTAPNESPIEQTPIPTFAQFLQAGTMPSVGPPPTDPPAPPTDPSNQPAEGWFPAPGGPHGQQRYWDGSSWTGDFK